jgi:uncharacterized protein
MRIAVVGGGVAGLIATWLLRERHDVCLYEKAGYVGGHAHTATLTFRGQPFPVDTAFITFSRERYPIFSRLLDHLGIASLTAPTSFSCSITGQDVSYVYGPQRTRFRASLADWRTPEFRRMMMDTIRFFRKAPELLNGHNGAGHLTIGQYLEREGYSREFAVNLILPVASALWSLPLRAVADFDAAAFVGTFRDAGYLSIWRRQHWRTVAGGSQQYVRRLVADLGPRVRASTEVTRVCRHENGVLIRDAKGSEDTFDQVVMASHADQTLRMLGDASETERRVLGAFSYFPNTLFLHHDTGLMPRARSRWATWNYFATPDDQARPVSHTYWMNTLQGLDQAFPTFVSLNPLQDPSAPAVEAIYRYEHPTLDIASVEAQRELSRIQGVNRTWFCGACYEKWGSHEDALRTGLNVARRFGSELPWQRDDA